MASRRPQDAIEICSPAMIIGVSKERAGGTCAGGCLDARVGRCGRGFPSISMIASRQYGTVLHGC
jgi:hypothetical protein